MSNQIDAPALDRLRRFEHDNPPESHPDAPVGSPGVQMATSIILPARMSTRRSVVPGVCATSDVAVVTATMIDHMMACSFGMAVCGLASHHVRVGHNVPFGATPGPPT